MYTFALSFSVFLYFLVKLRRGKETCVKQIITHCKSQSYTFIILTKNHLTMQCLIHFQGNGNIPKFEHAFLHE